MYKLTPQNYLGNVECIKRLSDGAFIPFSEGNTDYQAYLKWLDAGNVPIPAEEGNE
jgi:hypothetical protein